MRKFPTLGDMVVMLLLFFVAQMLVGLVANLCGFVAPVTHAIDSVDIETYMSEQEALGRYIAIFYPVSFLLSIGALWLYVRLRSGKRSINIRHSASGFNPAVVLVGVLWLFSSQIILEPIVTLLPENPGQGLGRGVWACFTAVVSAAVLEELLCRGLIFEVLHKRLGVKTSILFSSLFFGLIHFDIATAIVAVVAGVIFGILYVRTSSLYTTIVIHSINNALAFAMICFGVGDMSLYDIMGGGVAYWVVYGIAAIIFSACFVEAYLKVFRTKKTDN
jgi:membrane protease YdiL (CAAX protease family)